VVSPHGASFQEYVASRGQSLARLAYLLSATVATPVRRDDHHSERQMGDFS
jgi:hypothetical protein